MPRPERQQQVLDLLKGLRGIEPLKQLFWSELKYQRVNQPLSRRGWTESAAQALADDPVLFAGGGENNDFHVIYGRLASDRLLLGAERPVVSRLLREHPYALFVFSNKAQDRWHFLNVKYDKAVERRQLFRRIAVVPGDGLRTASERIALLSLDEISPKLLGISPLTIQEHHDAAFDVEKVTKDFYGEIANWYFWATDHVEFPMPKGTANPDAYKAQSLIRLITRLIFCWFVKEKGLIPGELFDPRALAKLLKGFDGGADIPVCAKGKGQTGMSVPHSVFYKAILQNLFFATLNQEMDKRQFRKRHKDPHGRDPHRGITNLYRYEDYFTDPKAFLRLMKGIPFLNGGLFECLDKVYRAEENLPEVRIDGFSDHPKNPLRVPDFLFFGEERAVDLSAAYGEKRYRQAKVRGLIHTFNRYKFTITENTPLDQEVALDPELSGKVFENLLAAYNPETATTARKQTGSFYTPREIVDYMVDEALMAYLGTALANGGPRSVVAAPPKTDATERVPPNEERLRHLFAYTDEPHQFTPAEVETLIAAIDNLKALDPACGSGAFPMGLLHKLVFILGKLDPHNERWKQKQIAKASEIPDATVREKTLADIEQAFAAGELDYGRKLYLIENCIYGVDIQPIAVQIAKMRFFISLIVEQTPSRQLSALSPQPSDLNLGIRPLPNLETKFVAANTLIGIEKPESQGKLFADPKVTELMTKLTDIRHQMFTAKSPQRKQRLRERDDAIRAKMADHVKTAFIRAAKEEEDKTRQALEQAMASLAEEKAKPPEWQINRFKNLFGEIEETRIDLSKERKQRLADRIKELERKLRRTAQVAKEIDAVVHQLANWNPYDQNASADFFDPEWMFGLAQPFDIVLGNPPYGADISASEMERIAPRILETENSNSAALFIDVAKNILTHHQGVVSFVVPKSLLYSERWFSLVKVLAPNTSAMVDLEQAFENVLLEQVVFVFRQSHPVSSYRAYKFRETGFAERAIVPVSAVSRYLTWPCDVTDSELRLGTKISDSGIFMRDVSRSFRGFPLQQSLAPSGKFHVIGGKNIVRYGVKGFKGCVRQSDLDLVNKKVAALLQPKVISQQIVAHIQNPRPHIMIIASVDQAGDVLGLDTVENTIPTNNAIHLNTIAALFNSALINWYTYRFIYCAAVRTMHFDEHYIGKIPLPADYKEKQQSLIALVDKILAAKRADPAADTSALEREIDERVYKLYGLTRDEIKLVEESAQR